MFVSRGVSALSFIFASSLVYACASPPPEVSEVSAAWTGVWQQQLSAMDLATGDRLGTSVALQGDHLLAGRPHDESGVIANAGSVVAYVRQGDGSFVEEAVLATSTPATNGYFGATLALDGDTAVVGAWGEGQDSTGAAYVMVRDPNNGTWSQQAKLLASDGDTTDYFGFEVALAGNIAAIGSINYEVQSGTVNVGAVYTYVRSGMAWTQTAIISPPTNASYQYFGRAIALEGNRIVIGAPKGAGSNGPGRVHIYDTADGGQTWTFDSTLVPSMAANLDRFGREVALSGDTIVANSEVQDGFAVVFDRVNGAWTQTAVLAGTSPSGFGRALSFDGEALAVGAPLRDQPASNAGGLYLYRRSMGSWSFGGDLVPMGLGGNANLGTAVAVSGSRLAVGAPRQGNVASDGGAVFVAQIGGELGDGCTDDMGCLSGFCVEGMCCDTACDGGCGVCDLTGSEGTCSAAPSGTSCRTAAEDCDAEEVCDGTALSCPDDVAAPDGAACDGGSCEGGICVEDGAGGAGGAGPATVTTGVTASSSSSAGGSRPVPVEDEGGCSVAARSPVGWWPLLLALLLGRRRR